MTATDGLFDLQVNGFAGVDFNDAALTPDAFDHALEAMRRTGVTGCLPTLITAHESELEARFAALDRAVRASRLGPLMVPGYHLEGPFLNPAPGFAGCHPPQAMVAADIALVERLQGRIGSPILMVTVAPEVAGGIAFVRAAAAKGIVVALGHSNADAAAVRAAAAAGATLSTHLGNGVAHQQHKFDNALFAQLAEDRLSATFIADGIHVPPDALKIMLRAKTAPRGLLVTDAVAGAAAPPGRYAFASMMVDKREDGSVRQADSPYLAGSALTMDDAVRNVVRWGLMDFSEAIVAAAVRPRAVMQQACAARGIALPPGRVRWDADFAVLETLLS